MRSIVTSVVSASLGLWVATMLVSGITVAPPVAYDGRLATILTFLAIGAILGVVNSVIRPIVKTLTFLLYVLTLGLFSIIVSALMLELTAWIAGFTPIRFEVGPLFFDAIFGAVIVGVVSAVFSAIVGGRGERGSRERYDERRSVERRY